MMHASHQWLPNTEFIQAWLEDKLSLGHGCIAAAYLAVARVPGC